MAAFRLASIAWCGITIGLSSVGPGLGAQVRLDHEPWASRLGVLEQNLASWMEQAVIPGVAIAVVTETETWARDFGVRGIDDGLEITPQTLFEAASLSKPLFAKVVMQEIANGLLELDTPLNQYWEYPDLRGDDRVGSVTARTVLSHRSGLPNWRRDEDLAIQFDPGTRYQYSGEGYVYLQQVLRALTGDGIEVRARTGVFEPLAMERSSYLFELSDSDHALPHHSRGYQLEKRPAPDPNAAASLHTTATDYGLFLQATLEALRRPENLALLSNDATEVADGLEWGLGWSLEHPNGRGIPALWHWGDNGPFKAFVYLDPAESVAFVFFANSTNGLAITNLVLETLFPGRHPALEWLRYDQLEVSPVGS